MGWSDLDWRWQTGSVGVVIIVATFVAVADLAGLVAGIVLAGLWVGLPPAAVIVGAYLLGAWLFPAPMLSFQPLAGLTIGTGLVVIAAVSRRHRLLNATESTLVIGAVLAGAWAVGWYWTQTDWGIALTLGIAVLLFGYTFHRVAVAITTEPLP